jgi:hypothetical protein
VPLTQQPGFDPQQVLTTSKHLDVYSEYSDSRQQMRGFAVYKKPYLLIISLCISVFHCTLIPVCRMEMGKDGSGRELSHKRNVGSTSSEPELYLVQIAKVFRIILSAFSILTLSLQAVKTQCLFQCRCSNAL